MEGDVRDIFQRMIRCEDSTNFLAQVLDVIKEIYVGDRNLYRLWRECCIRACGDVRP